MDANDAAVFEHGTQRHNGGTWLTVRGASSSGCRCGMTHVARRLGWLRSGAVLEIAFAFSDVGVAAPEGEDVEGQGHCGDGGQLGEVGAEVEVVDAAVGVDGHRGGGDGGAAPEDHSEVVGAADVVALVAAGWVAEGPVLDGPGAGGAEAER